MKARKGRGRVRVNLTDKHIQGVRDFAEGETRVLWDSKYLELMVRVGRTKVTWSYFAEHKRDGRRTTTCRRLGHWPAVTVAEARKAAKRFGGRLVDGRIEASAKDALRFTDAFDNYLDHLHRKAILAGRKPVWWHKVRNLGKLYLKPRFDGMTMAEISRDPQGVADWHADVTRRAGAVTANKAAKVLKTVYRFSARLRRDLPPELPTSGTILNPEEPRDAGMDEAGHRAWGEAWRRVRLPVHKAYFAVAILSGQRPGALSRVKTADVHDDHFMIRKDKMGDVWVPTSQALQAALKMAVKAAGGSEWLFPAGASHMTRFGDDGLPCYGNGLRHNFRTQASIMRPSVEEMLIEFLQGRAPRGVGRRYVSTMIMAKSDALREAQERINDRLMALIGLTAADFG